MRLRAHPRAPGHRLIAFNAFYGSSAGCGACCALVWGAAIALTVALVLTFLLWPLMAAARGLVDGLIQILGCCLPPELPRRVRSNHRQGEHEH